MLIYSPSITSSLSLHGNGHITGSLFVSGAISASFGPNTVGFFGTSSWAVSASWAPGSGVTILNNVDNRITTATGNANELNAESNLTFDGTRFILTGSAIISSSATIIGAGAATPFIITSTNTDSANSMISLTGANGIRGIIASTNGSAQYTARSANFTDRELRFQAFNDGNTYFSLQGLSGTVTGSLIIRTGVDAGTNNGSVILATTTTQRMRFGTTGIKVGAESTLPAANAILDISGSTIISGSLIVSPNLSQEFRVESTGVTIGNTLTDVHQVSGSLNISGSVYIQGLTTASQTNVLTYNASTGQLFYTASSAIAGGTSTPTFPFNGNAVITGSLLVSGSGLTITGSLNAPNITGSLFGTASWAQNVVTASYINGMIVKSGVVTAATFTGNPKKATVTFVTAFPNTNYSVTVTGQDARSWTIETLAAGSFVINANSNTALANDTYWQAISTGEFRS